MKYNQESYNNTKERWIPSMASGSITYYGVIVLKEQYLPKSSLVGNLVSNTYIISKGFALMDAVTFANKVTKARMSVISKKYIWLSRNKQNTKQNIDYSNVSNIDLTSYNITTGENF